MNRLIATIALTGTLLAAYSNPKAEAFAPTTHEEAYIKGEKAFEEGNYEEALSLLNTAIAEAGDRYKYFFLRALVNKQVENAEAAIADFTRAINLKATAEALYERGILHLSNGDMDAAKSDFEDVKMSSVNFKSIQYYLGLVYYRAGVFEHAVNALNAYAASTGGDGDTYYYLGLAQAALKKYDAAIDNLNKALPYKKNNLLIHVKMYELYVQTNKTEKAIKSLSAMIDLTNGSKKSEYYMERSLLHAQLGDITSANADRAKARTSTASVFGDM